MPASSPNKAKALAMYRANPEISISEIAKALNVNRGTISKWLKKAKQRSEPENEISNLIALAQAKFDELPPSEAEKLNQLRDQLNEKKQVIIKRQIQLLESVQGEAITALRTKDLPTVRAAASLISALTRAFAHEAMVYQIIDPAEVMRNALKD